MKTTILQVPQPYTQEEQTDMIVKIVKGLEDERDHRLKVIVIMGDGNKALVCLSDDDRPAFEANEPKAVGAHVIIVDEDKARRLGVI